MKMPMMLESINRRTLASRSARSRYKRVFSVTSINAPTISRLPAASLKAWLNTCTNLSKPARHQQAGRNVEILFTARCLVDKLTYHCAVVGVKALQHSFYRRLDARVVFENPIGFVRPLKFAAAGRPAETACATQALGFGEIDLTAPQPVFGSLAFININRQAVPLDDAALSIT
jgi:hypothetical protein